MFEKYISSTKVTENIVSAVLKDGASAALESEEEYTTYLRAWGSLRADEQIILQIMCGQNLSKMNRIRKVEETLHISQAQAYRFKEKTLKKLAQMLF